MEVFQSYLVNKYDNVNISRQKLLPKLWTCYKFFDILDYEMNLIKIWE